MIIKLIKQFVILLNEECKLPCNTYELMKNPLKSQNYGCLSLIIMPFYSMARNLVFNISLLYIASPSRNESEIHFTKLAEKRFEIPAISLELFDLSII